MILTDSTFTPVPPEPTSPQRPDMLIAALLHLMSSFSLHQCNGIVCTRLAAVIERHVRALLNDETLSPVLQATCMQLCEQWNTIRDASARLGPE